MPVCFQLFRKGEEEPTPLQTIDEELCAHFQQPIHPTRYLDGWYDSIGFRLACGDSWKKIREELKEYEGLLLICSYLEKNFDPHHWRESSSHPR